MKLQLNTNLVPIFSGTYETYWSELYDYSDNGDQHPLEYDHKELMKSIAGAYQNNADYILSELDIPWVKSIKFTGDFTSPREYNFSTDTLDFEVEINQRQMIKHLKSLKNDQDFAKWLKDTFSSYDGFISFTPNNYSDLLAEILGEGREYDQAISALIRWAAKNDVNIDTYHNGIESDVFEDWQGNGYNGLETWIECGEDYHHRLEYSQEDGDFYCTTKGCKNARKV